MRERELLAFELAPHPGSAAGARARILAAMQGTLDEPGRETLELLVSELVTNAILHGSSGTSTLRVSLQRSHERIRVSVTDGGDGFVPHPRSLESEAVGGWGLYLVERLSAAWGVSSGDGTTVWFELPCQAGA